ncbi:hypothetical protein [Sporosarcina globispora]|uniref:hypothetical protein n=1 Tax=Sporosarcina globispora TaxID=1459 RepID=UPI000A91D6AB|nr:hypothetical protein [Sporosarcina globispora]
MTYEEYVLDVFTEHHLSVGQDLEEIKDVIREASFKKIEKWLTKIGYDLNEYNSL